jgi:hypothetical protein
MPADSIAWLRAQALRALGLDPFNLAALRQVTGVDGNLSALRKAALRSRGIDPFDYAALRRTIGTMPAPPPPPPAARGGRPQAQPGPRKPRKARRVPKPFNDFLLSGCKNLKLAAKVLGIAPKPPIYRKTLRCAWIELIGKHHPDKGGIVEIAQAINAAYQLLSKFATY